MKKISLLLLTLFTLCNSMATAREVIALNDNWRFYFSFENSADYARTISLPHTWAYESNSALIATQPSVANYIRDLYAPQEWSGKRVFIKFYGVETVADLMVNGRYVGEHRGGGTAFTFEITSYLRSSQTNRIHVAVNDAPQTDVLPTSQEENRYGGIYRDVELIVTDQTAVTPLYYGTDGVFVDTTAVSSSTAEGVVKVFLTSRGAGATCKVDLSIYDEVGNLVFHNDVAKTKVVAGQPVLLSFLINSPSLWSPSSPNLYRFVVDVVDGQNSDRVAVTSGFRTIDYSGKGALHINGEAYQWRGVALYHDYPHVGGAATERDIDADMDIIEELGANGIRSVTHPHHPYLYELCDKHGKMVWIDFPLVKAPFLSDVAYYPTARFHESGRETMHEIVLQNYNHPSVVMWGIFSLLSPRGDNVVPFIKEINSLAKSLDATRPTVAVSDQDGQINTITDLIVWRQAFGWDKGLYSDLDVWSNLIHTRWSSMRSAVSYGQSGRFDQQAEPLDYKADNLVVATTWNPEGRARIFHEEYSSRLGVDSLFWGVCLNSMFDFKSCRNHLGENNSGLVTFDRRNRKDIFYLYKSHWNSFSPTLHIADKRNKISSSDQHRVSVYSSDTIAPTLYFGGDTITMQRLAPWHFAADSLTLAPGVNRIVVEQGNMVDSTSVVYQTTSQRTTQRSSFGR